MTPFNNKKILFLLGKVHHGTFCTSIWTEPNVLLGKNSNIYLAQTAVFDKKRWSVYTTDLNQSKYLGVLNITEDFKNIMC